MSDANIRILAEVCDRPAEIAAAYGLSLRAYLARLAHTLLTPEARAERAAARCVPSGAATRWPRV
ncbi:hypothetical protein ACIOHS_10410 [Streptomyces sp. NPDC088253]|uniref:hypothetical protein n=1 Tax=Streptomyces sp. NPDC088253 TaxID=3365846 RepID=UPI0038045013